jgi:putative oxidoreductase
MNALIWIAQLSLAAIFLTTGMVKLFGSTTLVQGLHDRTHGAITILPVQRSLIGLIEIALAFGVIMPDIFAADRLVPEYLLIRLSAAGLALLMVIAGIYHARHKESASLAISIFLLALFVIVGRS